MKRSAAASVRDVWKADFLSAKDLIRRSLFLIALYSIVHLAGFREFTSVLSGTTPSPGMAWQVSVFLALTYILSYLSFVLLVPVLIFSALILFVLNRISSKRKRADVSKHSI